MLQHPQVLDGAQLQGSSCLAPRWRGERFRSGCGLPSPSQWGPRVWLPGLRHGVQVQLPAVQVRLPGPRRWGLGPAAGYLASAARYGSGCPALCLGVPGSGCSAPPSGVLGSGYGRPALHRGWCVGECVCVCPFPGCPAQGSAPGPARAGALDIRDCRGAFGGASVVLSLWPT